ncbi:MAG: pentapeptide repeat-containing protein [Rivularia sp. (in: Bacteria)]|nr:pentapeptide repeat-containing protein [Rivularia sp. MS3]
MTKFSELLQLFKERQKVLVTGIIILASIAIFLLLLPELYKFDWIGFGTISDIYISDEEAINFKTGNIVTLHKQTEHIKSAKKLWDWLELLGIPVLLVILGTQFKINEKKLAEEKVRIEKERAEEQAKAEKERVEEQVKAEKERADEQVKAERQKTTNILNEEALQAYIDRMSELLLDKNLKSLSPTNPLREAALDVARARTLSVLRRLDIDGERKGSIIRFLIDAEFINELQLDLSYAKLSGADLSGANLSGANFYGANFHGVKLNGAKLNGAKLSGANFYGAKLSGANFYGADLSGAKLSGVKLSGANFYGADLSRAYLSGANLNGANFYSANLSSTNLSSANLCFANLSAANLCFANLLGAYLSHAKLSGANLSGANFFSANLSDAKLSGANFCNTKLNSADLNGANLVEAKNLTLEQIKQAKNANKAVYTPEFYKQLLLSVNSEQ